MNTASRHAYSMVARAESMSATRERIVRAALKLALERAYEEITLIGIAETAGVSHQTVLNHFGSKENVAAAVAPAARCRAMHAATDVYTWKLLRRDLRLSPPETEQIMVELVNGVLAGVRRHAYRKRSGAAAQ